MKLTKSKYYYQKQLKDYLKRDTHKQDPRKLFTLNYRVQYYSKTAQARLQKVGKELGLNETKLRKLLYEYKSIHPAGKVDIKNVKQAKHLVEKLTSFIEGSDKRFNQYRENALHAMSTRTTAEPIVYWDDWLNSDEWVRVALSRHVDFMLFYTASENELRTLCGFEPIADWLGDVPIFD